MEFNCESCGHSISVPESAISKRAKCPKCNKINTVKEPVLEAVMLGDAENEMLAEEIRVLPLEPALGDPQKVCPYCREHILASAIKCKHCDEFLDGLVRSPITPPPVHINANSQEAIPWPTNMFILYIILTALIPPAGLILGIYGLTQNPKRPHGVALIVIAIILSLVYLGLLLETNYIR